MKKWTVLITLLMVAFAMGETILPQPKITYRYGDKAPVVFAGDTIEPVVYVVKGAHVVEFSLMDSLAGVFEYDDFVNDSLVTISGRVSADTDPGEYLIQILAKDTSNETSVNSMFYITVLSKEEAFVHSSGKLAQTVTAGDSIEPIVFDYVKMRGIAIDQLPPGLTVVEDTSSKTVTVSGVAEAAYKDEKYTFAVVARLTERDSVVYNCELDVEHIPVVTVIKVLENDSQAVVAGDSIKPITLKYQNITDLHFKDIPKTLDVLDDADEKKILLRGIVPEDFGDTLLVMSVCAKGYDNNDTAYITLDIKHNPKMSIEPAVSIRGAGFVNWSFGANMLSVLTSNPVSVQVVDLMGNLLKSYNLKTSAVIDLGYLPRGTYLVRFAGDASAKTSRITVK